MPSISKTTLAGIVRLFIIAACLYMLVTQKWGVAATALAMSSLLGAVGSLGLFAAKDDSAPQLVSQTTIQDVGEGKQQVRVETEMPSDGEKEKV
jgi:hypothetical protein